MYRTRVIALLSIPLLVYLGSMSHHWALDSIYAIDSAEMVIAARTLGVDHPPGHPLYLIIAHVFSLLPFGNPDIGVILTSSVLGALASLGLGIAIFNRTRSVAASLGCAWTMAFGLVFWIHAVIAEVYTAQLAFLAVFLVLTQRLADRRDRQSLALFAFGLGLGATTNVLLFTLLLPGAAYVVVRSGVIVEPRRLFAAMGWGMLGLTPLLYIPFRIHQGAAFISDFVYLNGYEVLSLRWFRWYLTAEEFTATKLFAIPLSDYPSLLLSYVESFARNVSWPAAIISLAAVGSIPTRAWMQWKRPDGPSVRRRRSETRPPLSDRLTSDSPDVIFDGTILISVACTLGPVLSYDVPDRDVFFMPSFFFLTACFGLGLSQIHRALDARLGPKRSRLPVAVIALAVPALLLVQNSPVVLSITEDTETYRLREDRFRALPEKAVIVSEDDGRATRYKYFQLVRDLRPDVSIHTLGRMAPRFTEEAPVLASVTNAQDLRLGLNLADRLRILRRLLAEAPDRPHFAILDDRMPPEFDHFRIRRSMLDPRLLRVLPKPPALVSQEPIPVARSIDGADYGVFRITGFTLTGLDGGATRTFGSPLPFKGRDIDGIVERSELFDLALVVRRTGKLSGSLFAELAFVNDRMQIPSAHGFTAARQMEIGDTDLPDGWERQSILTFKIPATIPSGFHTLAARLSMSTEVPAGSYRGKPVRTLVTLQAPAPWRGQQEYVPLGKIWVE